MRSIVEIVTPTESELLTTLARVKAELQITTDANDEILEAKIAEASSDIQAALGKRMLSNRTQVRPPFRGQE